MKRGRATAAYTYELRGALAIVIEHDGAPCSVTNDAENVIAEMAADGLDFTGRRVIYRDQMGAWDELLVSGNRFAGFRLLDGLTLNHVLRLVGPDAGNAAP